MSKTEKPISKNSPEAIANNNVIPMRINWGEAEKNHPFLTSVAISGGSYMAGKKILVVSLKSQMLEQALTQTQMNLLILQQMYLMGQRKLLPACCMVLVQLVHCISCQKTNNETY